jgi:hypothetical protein
MGLRWDLCSGFLDELADSLIERLAKDSVMSDILLCELKLRSESEDVMSILIIDIDI